MSTKAVVVFSGGLDSTVLLAQCLQEYPTVSAIHFMYGSSHTTRETEAANVICAKLGVEIQNITLPFIPWGFKSGLLSGDIPDGHYEDESMKKTIVPFRNGIMLSIAAGLVACDEEAVDLCIAVHAGDHTIYPDCRVEFIDDMRRALLRGTNELITLSAPFLNYGKADIVIRGRGVRAPMELSWSCYKGGEKHCGVCGTCVERKEAFAVADVVDPTVYGKEM